MAVTNPRAARVGLVLAMSAPAAVQLATLSGYAYWLDSGEFVSVAADLGISHPPGHPLAALVSSLARCLPFGPLALRVACIGSLLTVLSSGLLFTALTKAMHALALVRTSIALPLAVGASWAFALSGPVMVAATRPEVYALETFLTLVVLERLVELETVRPSTDLRAVATVGLAFGLGLANHHFLTMLVLPIVMPTFARIAATGRVGALLPAVPAALVGLSAYALLPLRALADPMLSFGEPSSLGRFAWVVSAAPFHKNVGSAGTEPLADRLSDVGVIVLEALSPFGFAMALLGAYLLVRDGTGRRFAVIFFGYFVTAMIARAWLGFADDNADATAYLGPAIASATALAALGAGLVLERWLLARVPRPVLAGGLALAFVVLLLAPLRPSVARVSLARFVDTDAFDDGLRRELPHRAVLFAFDPSTVFRFVGGESEEHARPDVLLVPMSFLGYPYALDALAREHPELEPVLRAYALHGHLTLPDLQTLANERPVLVELDPRVTADVQEALAPNGLYFELLPGGTTDGDEREGRRSATLAWRALAREVDPLTDTESRRIVVWRQLLATQYYAAFGDLESARACLAVARAFAPADETLAAVARALAEPEARRVDLGPLIAPVR